MRAAATILRELIGLFVADWPQTVLILATLILGWWASQHLVGFPVGFILTAVLILELIGGSIIEARRRTRPRPAR